MFWRRKSSRYRVLLIDQVYLMIGEANDMRSNPPNKPGNIEPATRDRMNAEWFAVCGQTNYIQTR